MRLWRNTDETTPATLPLHGEGSPDSDLVQAAIRGDKRAFVSIVARHQAMVCGITLTILGNFAESEDAAQDTFVSAWRNLRNLRNPGKLRSWLAQIARNSALERLRRNKRHVPLDDALLVEDAAATPDKAAATEEEAAIVCSSLAKLPELYRLPLILFYRESQSVRAVAETLGLSEDAVKQRLARGREMLRNEVSGLIEDVLTRTGPTAAFTVSVAAAIGALAAPAAIASGAFATTSTASAAPVTVTTTAPSTTAAAAPLANSTLALMAWSKTKIALTALVAFVLLNSAVLVTFLVVQQGRHEQSDGFTPLFNGRDLTGWKYNADVWSVVDGAIVGRLSPEQRMQNHCLIWDGGHVEDFELRLKFRTTPNANSGVSFRSTEVRSGALFGYHAEIEGARTGLFVIGGPGRERRLSRPGWRTIAREENGQDILEQVEELTDQAQVAEVRAAVDRGEWCDYTLIAQGPRIIIQLNGVTITDTTDEHPSKFVPSGPLGLEYYHNSGKEDSVEFKDIRFKRLSADISGETRSNP
jgi:RNA polymerase sigma factor (sigma-70 family)